MKRILRLSTLAAAMVAAVLLPALAPVSPAATAGPYDYGGGYAPGYSGYSGYGYGPYGYGGYTYAAPRAYIVPPYRSYIYPGYGTGPYGYGYTGGYVYRPYRAYSPYGSAVYGPYRSPGYGRHYGIYGPYAY